MAEADALDRAIREGAQANASIILGAALNSLEASVALLRLLVEPEPVEASGIETMGQTVSDDPAQESHAAGPPGP